MRTTRKSLEAPVVTEAQMRSSLEAYVAARCEIDKINAHAKAEIEEVKARAGLAAAPHENVLKAHESIVVAYIESHAADFTLPHPRKIEVYGGHKIGLQLGKPTVQLIRPTGQKTKQTEEGFIAICHQTNQLAFIRVIEEMDRDAILTARREIESREDDARAEALQDFDQGLAALGARVTQTEKAVIDLNLTPEAVEA